MRFVILCVAVWGFVISNPAFGADAHRLNQDCTLFVERGDSYIKLFGRDWMKVSRANSDMAFYNADGKLVHNPDKLVTGTRLVIPKGTRLTEMAVKRLSRYERVKAAANKAIRKAGSFVVKPPKFKTEAYEQGVKLLLRANAAARGLTCGFENYLDAGDMAEEAIRCFEIDAVFHNSRNDAALLLRKQTPKDTFVVKNEMQNINYRRELPLGLGIIFFSGLVWRLSRRKKKARIGRIKGWLTGHEKELERLDIVLAQGT